MAKFKNSNGNAGSSSQSVTLDDVRDELRIANRLMVANLALGGLTQRDIAAVIGKDESGISRMFPNGLLKRLAKSGKMGASTSDLD